ncbi:MAG: hypothetical protein IPP07_03295 [Holophagales bacterium]|nr:hypothetical protein [Holophagales bacterium]
MVGRRALEETLRKLGNAEMEKAAERFRLQTLQSRFNSFAELWEKRMQAREEGRTGPIHRHAPVLAAAGLPSAPGAAAAGKAATKKPAEVPDVAALLAAAERAVGGRAPEAVPPPRPDAAPPSSVKPRSRVDFTPLFERYVAARQALGEDVSRLRYEKFEESVRRQADEIRQKTGSSRLVFEVQTTEGRVRLVGRPAAPGPKG